MLFNSDSISANIVFISPLLPGNPSYLLPLVVLSIVFSFLELSDVTAVVLLRVLFLLLLLFAMARDMSQVVLSFRLFKPASGLLLLLLLLLLLFSAVPSCSISLVLR